MNTPRPSLPGVSPHPLIQPDDHGDGWWAFSVVRHRIVGAVLLPDARSARLVALELQAALAALWEAPRTAQRREP